jgi:cytochrome b561
MKERYSGLSRALHWLSALIIFALIVVGWYMAGLEDNDPSRAGIYALHKSMGVLTVFLLVARLAWLRANPGPELPAVFNAKEKRITKGVQSLLYLLLLLVPMSGYVMSTAAGYPVSFFGLFPMPTLIGESKAIAGFAHEAHEILAYSILALVALHMAGAIKHRLTNKGGEADVLARML